MRVRLQVVIETDEGQVQDVQDVFELHRGELKPERLGLTLEEAKATLEGVQRVLAARQVEEYVEAQRRCPVCNRPRSQKGQHEIVYRTLFGRLRGRVRGCMNAAAKFRGGRASALWQNS